VSRKTRVDDKGRIFLGGSLRTFREEFLKMTQDEMAAIMHVPQRLISDWETGKKDLTPGDIASIYYGFKDYKKFEESNIVEEYRELQSHYWETALGVT
jgi:transcriptional regulator with XRE-family HTH domain